MPYAGSRLRDQFGGYQGDLMSGFEEHDGLEIRLMWGSS
jgi:hypothetical protein